MVLDESYTGERTGIEATVTETTTPDGAYAVKINFSEDFDGPLYPGVAGEEMLELAEDLYTEDSHFQALYVGDGEAFLTFPDDDEDAATAVVEGVVENVDRYYDKLGDAPLPQYLEELPEDAL